MQFLKFVSFYIILFAVGTHCSQAQDTQSSLYAQAAGVNGDKYWSHFQSLSTESLSNVNANDGSKEKIKNDKTNTNQLVSKSNSTGNNPCDPSNLLYVVGPQKIATKDMFDMKIQKDKICDPREITQKSNPMKSINKIPKSNMSKDETCRVLMRDTDSFYDNELIQKVSGNNGELPESLHVDSLNRDPILVYKEPNRESQKVIIKRAAKKSSDDDYVYYDDKTAEDSSGVKGGLLGIKQKLSKIIRSKEKNRETKASTDPSTHKTETTRTGSSQKTTVTSSVTVQPTSESSRENASVTLEENSTSSQIEENEPDEVNELNESSKSEENTKIKSAPKKKDPCRFGQDEKLKCLPPGGAPKNPGIPPLGRSRDAEYEKAIRGELPERIVKTVFDKLKRNPTLASELGVCEADFKEVKDLYNSIRNKQNECCMKLKGEFKCFLNWLLTVDPSRKKRSPRHEQIGLSKVPSTKLYDLDKCPSYIEGIHRPSPQYQRLFEEVERSKREGDPWNFSPDAMHP